MTTTAKTAARRPKSDEWRRPFEGAEDGTSGCSPLTSSSGVEDMIDGGRKQGEPNCPPRRCQQYIVCALLYDLR